MQKDIGNVEQIIRETKRTHYKLHPDALITWDEARMRGWSEESWKAVRGLVIEMPNLPNESIDGHSLWELKGYKPNPQDLMPQNELIEENGEFRFKLDSPTPSEEFKCEVCGKVCASKLGLGAHMKSHK